MSNANTFDKFLQKNKICHYYAINSRDTVKVVFFLKRRGNIYKYMWMGTFVGNKNRPKAVDTIQVINYGIMKTNKDMNIAMDIPIDSKFNIMKLSNEIYYIIFVRTTLEFMSILQKKIIIDFGGSLDAFIHKNNVRNYFKKGKELRAECLLKIMINKMDKI